MQKLQEKLSAFIGVLSANPYILAIRNAMLAYMPFTIIASIFLILANMPFEGFNTFVSSITGLEAAVWQGKLWVPGCINSSATKASRSKCPTRSRRPSPPPLKR